MNGHNFPDAPCCSRPLQAERLSLTGEFLMTSFPHFVTLTRAQENALLDAAYPDAIIGQLEKCGNQHLEEIPQSARYAFIAQQIEKAQKQYRIDATADILLFCTLALAGGMDFDRQPRIARVLNRVLEEGVSFGKAYWQDFPAQPVQS
jgi:hypothetical protein